MNLSEICNLPKCATEDEIAGFLILTKDRRKQCCTEGGSQVSIELRNIIHWRSVCWGGQG